MTLELEGSVAHELVRGSADNAQNFERTLRLAAAASPTLQHVAMGNVVASTSGAVAPMIVTIEDANYLVVAVSNANGLSNPSSELSAELDLWAREASASLLDFESHLG